jgi:putative membrane protein
MVMRVEDLFNEEAQEAVRKAVRSAEKNTAGEIVPMVVERSEDYRGVRALAAAILAFSAGVVLLASPLEARFWVPPVQLGAFVLAYALAGWPPVLRLLLPTSIRAQAVRRTAHLAFVEEGVVETRDRTGILIYISLLEHRVEVVADRGIDERVQEGTWDGVVRLILDGIRRERAEEGLVDAIRLCGEILATQFPPRPDDTDELANRLRV